MWDSNPYKIIGKDKLEYYLIYDLNDNLIAYIDTKKELSNFTGLRIKDINYKFKQKNHIYSFLNKKIYVIYKFKG